LGARQAHKEEKVIIWTANEDSPSAASAEPFTAAICQDALIAAQAGSARYLDTE